MNISSAQVLRFIVFALGLTALLAGSGVSAGAMADELTVFAASSLTEVVEALAADFEQRSGHDVTVVTAASSTLARQIEKGAPADIFISANKEWAEYVVSARGFAPSMPLFGNRLVLVSRLAFEVPPDLMQLPDLLGDGRLATGDPAHVPVGQYTQEALEAAGIWNDVRERLAPASDVRGALAFVTQGAAQFGIVYATDAKGVVPVALEINPALHGPITYYAVAPKTTSRSVSMLMDYLSGVDAERIVSGMGFLPLKD